MGICPHSLFLNTLFYPRGVNHALDGLVSSIFENAPPGLIGEEPSLDVLLHSK